MVAKQRLYVEGTKQELFESEIEHFQVKRGQDPGQLVRRVYWSSGRECGEMGRVPSDSGDNRRERDPHL